MKKLLALSLTLLMLVACATTSFAALGEFVESPSGVPAPMLIEFESVDGSCTGSIVLTPYSERDTLSDEGEAEINESAAAIRNAADITTICTGLAGVAEAKNLDKGLLAVSNLFDISVKCDMGHESHGEFRIKLQPEEVENFAALIHYTGENWEVIETTVDGEYVVFTVGAFSPYAIVVDTAEAGTQGGEQDGTQGGSSQTGDNIVAYSIIMAVSALGMVFFFVKSRKTAKNAR